MSQPELQIPPYDLMVFGATGDLALRKLFPALYHIERDGYMPPQSKLIGCSRSDLSDEAFSAQVVEALERFLPKDELEEEALGRFKQHLVYHQVDAQDASSFGDLKAQLEPGAERTRIFYFSTSPSLFTPIAENLHASGLVGATSRVVLEKPLGHDLTSSRRINDAMAKVFDEHQIYRIDHYLGKEAVQNLLVLRFANTIFEPLWNHANIEHVQITVAETVGVEGRWGYYDGAGALRDMVQNHLLQLLCLVALEPPASMETTRVRDEKVKVLESLRPLSGQDVLQETVRGQYSAGAVAGTAVPGYLEEDGANPQSHTETYVAIRAAIDNWRWTGVPFYLRTGKRLPERVSEIVVQFRKVPHVIFEGVEDLIKPNVLVIRLQPDEGIKLLMTNKSPGPGRYITRFKRAPLNLSFAEAFGMRHPDAYERLLLDVTRGISTLFMRRDEVDAAWTWVDAIIQTWQGRDDMPKKYPAGTWGPSSAVAMIERAGHTWHEDMG